jgi:DNA modification methylase
MAKQTKETLFDAGSDKCAQGPVECLGMTFPNDEARRAHFTEKLREKLKDPAFRKIEGFPIGEDEDILALSDPPYYTACPNPFLEDFIRKYAKSFSSKTDSYRREPFSADVSEGKNDPIYDAHSYHTKVPHKAIMRYVLHYTEPGDVVFDGFCGTGMTAVASMLCGDKQTVESLGYSVARDGTIKDKGGHPISRLGARPAIASDISPIATFIARNLLTPLAPDAFLEEAARVVGRARTELPWLYSIKAKHSEHEMIYSVWSDVLICSECGAEMVAWDLVVDHDNEVMKAEFDCPKCSASLKRRTLDKSLTTSADLLSGKPHQHTKQKQVLIHYKHGSGRDVKAPDKSDEETISRAVAAIGKYSIPTCSFEHTWRHLRDGNHLRGITDSHHYYTPRNLLALGALLKHIKDSLHRLHMMFVLTGFLDGHANRRNRYIVDRHHPEGTTCGPLSNTLFVPEVQCEVNLFNVWTKTAKKQAKAKATRCPMDFQVQVRSATSVGIPDSTVDYIFVDPPFGKNIMYSDLNLLYEAWLGVRTAFGPEAIVNDQQAKGLNEYGDLITKSFEEFYRILKPGRWMTLEFHNSQNAVWGRIQEALARAGFVVADVRVLDKKHGTIHQDSGYTVKQDLIVSAYKPVLGLEVRFQVIAGTEEGAWEFVRCHLRQLPVCVVKDNGAEVVAERQPYVLFDRMVAFHVQRGHSVPVSAAEFHQGLRQRFPERDGMYFLSDQVADYDKKRLDFKAIEQLQLFVSDEKSAIQWVRSRLSVSPMSLSELQPIYMKEAQRVWEKHEQPLELRTILEQSFVEDEDGAWRIPDPKKEADLEQLRNRALLKEFQQYLDTKGKLKVVRTESLRAGFKDAWQKAQYSTIVETAKRIPEAVVQEDSAILMYYDNALLRTGE